MRIEFDNVYANIVHIEDNEIAALNMVTENNRVDAPGNKYAPAHKIWIETKGKRGWDGKVSLIKKDESFLCGMLGKVVAGLKAYGVSPELIDSRSCKEFPTPGNVSVNLRPYQWDALTIGSQNVFNNTWWPRGVFKIATGGGKTELAVAMYQYMSVPTLFLVNQKTLVNQAIDRFRKYGIDVGQMGDGVHDFREDGITVATIQTLASFVRNNKPLGWMNNIRQVFFDEAHMIAASVTKGNTFVQIAEILPNALMRWGLTATPFMKDAYSNFLLEGVTGGVIYTIKSIELIKMGYLTPPIIKMIPVPKIPKLPRDWKNAYSNGIILNDARNDIIIEQMSAVPRPVFVLVSERAHGEILQRKAEEAGLGNIPVLDYSSTTTLRERTVKAMIRGDFDFIIVTKIFDQGLDVPELQSIILAGGGKSNIKTIQRLGRLLRLHDSKKVVNLIDFRDSTGVLARHAKLRREQYKEEGYVVQ